VAYIINRFFCRTSAGILCIVWWRMYLFFTQWYCKCGLFNLWKGRI